MQHAMYHTLRSLIILTLGAIALGLSSCGNEVTQKMENKGTALGRMNEIVVIADDNLWEGAIGDTFKFYFESAFPILPQPEPMFDLRHFTPEDLKAQPLRKELRTYTILADLSDLESSTTQMVRKDVGAEKLDYGSDEKFSSVGRDKWARGQLLVYLYGKNGQKLEDAIKSSFSAVAKRVNQHDQKQLKAQLYVDQVNKGLTAKVTERFGLDLQIPGDFITATSDEQNNVLWLRKETKKAILNMVFQTIPYTDEKQLSKQGIMDMRNKFGSTYVTSDDPNDVMVIHTERLPVYEYSFKLDGRYGKELRGIWEMTNTFAGGPFNTYVILDEPNKRLIYIDAFVLGPGSKKRDLMMQLDYMVKSAKVL